MPTLVVRGPDGKEREVTLSGEMTIGRAEGNDLVLAEGGVSRQHAVVTLKGDAVMVEDRGSANGTFIEGQRVGSPTLVPAGKVLQIGDYELRVKPGGGPGMAIVKAPRPPTGKAKARPALGEPGAAPSTRTLPKKVGSGPPAPNGKRDGLARPARPQVAKQPGPRVVRDLPEGPALVGASGLWANKRWPIQGKAVVGRLPGVDVQLEDDSVSRRHAEIELTPRGVRLKDLNSANGTAVNGMPVEGSITLQHGDVIQFGVVELQYENDAEESLEASGASRPKRRRIVVAALALVVLGGAVAAKVLLPQVQSPGGKPPLVGGGPGPGQPEQAGTQDPQAAIAEMLAACRSFMQPDQGEPDWTRAEDACKKVLDLEPIQAEATSLLKQIKAEQEARAHFEKADNLTLRLHEEEALIEYGAIPSTSHYYLKVKPKIAEAVEKALKKSRAECDLYVRQRDWRSALPRCEAWMKLACQDMEKEEVTPPTGYTIRTNLPRGAKLKEREWAPPNPQVLKFYQVREKVDPTLPPWKCERMEILARGQQEESPEKAMARQMDRLYPERPLAAVAMDYWLGKSEPAVVAAQKIRRDVRRTELHAAAEQLALDVNAVASLYKSGQTFIQSNEVEKAADRYREALTIDQKLLGDTVEKWPSWYRDAILRDIAEATLQAGRTWMARNDRKSACKYWRLGFGFYRGNPELNRAIGNQCSSKASELFQQAQNCGDLDQVLLYAIDGDGVKERVADKKQQWGCPAGVDTGSPGR